MKKRAVGVLFSGGLDSAALIGALLERGHIVWPVYVQSGLRWERTELRAARRFVGAIHDRRLKPMKVVRLSLENAYRNNWSQKGRTPGAESDDRSVFLPARNLLLLIKALLYLSGHGIFQLSIATLKGNPFPDGRRAYFRKVEDVLSKGFTRRVRISSPFRSRSKSDVIRASRHYPLHLSMSCIAPRRGRHCGRCNKCAERKAAFRQADVEDRTRYATAERRKIRRSS
jgi:7-cyano-7-deazaguanine synthase